MNAISQQTLAEIVTTNHRAAAVFEKYQLDFCCRGKRSLKEACAEKSLDIEDVLSELQNTIASSNGNKDPSFDLLPLGLLADYIRDTHHAYTKKELPQIFLYLEKVSSKHGTRHPELFRIFDAFAAIKEEMEMHMQKEELVLFPRIKELERLKLENHASRLNVSHLLSPITVLEQEHEHAGMLMEEIRQLTNSYSAPADACTTFRLSYAALQAFEADLHQHVHLENNVLFPKAIELFRQVQALLN